MLQLVAINGRPLGEHCGSCGFSGPPSGCGWHGLIASVEAMVAELVAAGTVAARAVRVHGPDPRHQSKTVGCIQVCLRAGLREDLALRAEIEHVASEWEFEIQREDAAGYWLGHKEAPPTREARRRGSRSSPSGSLRRVADGDGSGS